MRTSVKATEAAIVGCLAEVAPMARPDSNNWDLNVLGTICRKQIGEDISAGCANGSSGMG